jgi:hypothetical protein
MNNHTNRGPAKRGRPSAYTPEIVDMICERLMDGESLRPICASAGMPDKATVFRWLACHKEFRGLYGWARERIQRRSMQSFSFHSHAPSTLKAPREAIAYRFSNEEIFASAAE